jgi:Kef-type K+ transport system membrane component KefB
MNETSILLLLFGVPAAVGAHMAWRRGKNPFLWGLLSGVVPFFLVVLYLQYKPLDKSAPPPSAGNR